MKSKPHRARAGTRNAATSKRRVKDSTRSSFSSPRQRRAARALLQADRTAQQLMRISPANNSAMIVKALRDRFGLSIPCMRVPFVTIDGRKSFFGRYTLTGNDRRKLQRILSGGGA